MAQPLNQSEIILYKTEDGSVKIDTIFQNETIWLTQKMMAELFDVQRPAITKHLKNVFESGELDEKVVSSILEHTTQHGAIEGKTAAELIESRSNPDKPNMGLTSWRGSIVRKHDVSIAKNYLNDEEMKDLNEIVTMYLDYAERQARKRRTVTMAEWSDKLDAFLKHNEEDLLTQAGTVKAEVAKKIAEERYEAFDKKRKIAEAKISDVEDLKELEEIEKRLLEHKK
ncbi:MAG: hypothetical protein BWY02_02256 [bacterium ADurb.Bin157]|nr:hypothetical protein [bacterium]OQB46671.1 MAG: hypothetical protein BWY02_02256 [bacterium ADurb.Bin157]